MTKPLQIPTYLGLKLAAVYHEPVNPGPHPLVILLHGFTGYKEEEHIVALAEALASQGIAALRFDAPGSGDSEGTWADDYRISTYLNAIPDLLGYTKTNLNINPNRVGIWGHSMGGFIALATAAQQRGAFKAVVGSEPSIEWVMLPEEKIETWREDGWALFDFKDTAKIKLPYEFFNERLGYSSLEEARKLAVPALFIAGTHDEDVPAQFVRAIFDAAPEPKTYLEFPTTHDYKRDPENLKKINAATVEFFANALK